MMPLLDRIVGQSTREFRYHVDARWLMAYAAGVEDLSPCYFDTTNAITAHPIFPVCLEWDASSLCATAPAPSR
jgi:N-terminal half of MaoC dehydratase